ncbi:MAG: citramalate synthase [Kiritimatiellae bacterium]|jgi:2-isopropylmalate synthase|nr:citramalate synthase [Kiritimatiellia bacterium]
MTKKIQIYDTTLRDGNQARNMSLSLDDKLNIAQKLAEFGVDYIEGGWPNATNQLDIHFFEQAAKLDLGSTKLTAFGSTRRPNSDVEQDATLNSLVEANTPVITIFGKTWDLHVKKVLKTTLEENLLMIKESVQYLKSKCEEVIYDAEHFFDGYRVNPEYAMQTLLAAEEGGADCIVLCETNGGMLPMDIREIMEVVAKTINTPLGIHTHDDSGCAVANSIEGVLAGAVQVQGTINGFGERCGNANLCTIIPNLYLKLGYECLSSSELKSLTEMSRYFSEIANLHDDIKQPYVGASAFAHKGGAHIDGVMKDPTTFEHIDPALVGNDRVYILSDQSGGSTIVKKLQQFLPHIEKKDPLVGQILAKVKDMEAEGYQFEAAEGSFRLLAAKEFGLYKEPFEFIGFRVMEEQKGGSHDPSAEATIKVKANGKLVHTAAEGDGPVNAMDNAIRKALEQFFPELADIRLIDYKVLVINGKEGTGAKVRVLIESADKTDTWGTVGVSANIIEASWLALLDSINYKLMKDSI